MSRQRIAVLLPSGNTTAVVFEPVAPEDAKRKNAAVIDAWAKTGSAEGVEQCCAVVAPKGDAVCRVEMFGGEFCGNATRAVLHLLSGGNDGKGTVEVSGAGKPLAYSITDGIVELEMPVADEGSVVTEVPDGFLVRLEGIAHVVSFAPEASTPRELLTSLIQENRYGLAKEPAVGVTFFDAMSGSASFCVWVREVDTMFDETACGSGTASIAAATAFMKKEPQTIEVLQPSGRLIRASATYDRTIDNVSRITISGAVETLYDGELEVAD